MEEIVYRVCKVCEKEKELVSNFYYHSATGYYKGTCIDCCNKKRREKYNNILLNKDDEFYVIREQKCTKCGEVKYIEDFVKLGGNRTKVCNSCLNEFSENNYNKRLNKGILSDDSKKVCYRCKDEKNILEFSYLKHVGRYSSYCKTCDQLKGKIYRAGLSEEKKEKSKLRNAGYKIKDNSKHLFNAYNKFDFLKGLETNLTLEYLRASLKELCIYCNYPSTGLDRKDNTKGHTQENCVPCCRECNTTRMDNYTHEEMLILGKTIKQIKDNRQWQQP